jgi:anaerobic magnesium-protoporphyrin IX monomethyl ester cyclase
MYKAGCRLICFGVESGSTILRSLINRSDNLQHTMKTIDLARKHNIKITAFFMIGFPNEELTSIIDTFKCAYSINADRTDFNILYPLPGTSIYHDLKHRYGIQRIAWRNYRISNSQYPISSLGPLQLAILLKLLNLFFGAKAQARKALIRRHDIRA